MRYAQRGTQLVTLTEQQPHDLPADALDEAAATLLHQRYRAQIDLEPPSFKTGGMWRLTAQGWVGQLPLTRRLSLVLQPKVPLANLFGMIETAYDLGELQTLPGVVQVATLPQLYAHLAHLLAQRVLAQGRTGLYRAYIDQTAPLTTVRGRIRTAGMGTALAVAALPCTHHTLTADVEDNRILAWTLHTLAQSGLCQGEAQRVVNLARQQLLAQVTLTPLAASVCRGRSYTRLNHAYAALHALCAFFLEQRGPGHRVGDRLMTPFLIDMARLYERFVARQLAHRLGGAYRVRAQVQTPVGRDLRFTLDLLISDAHRRWVVDTKYKTPVGGPAAADVAQVLAYAQVADAQEAVLVYPVPLAQPLDTTIRGIRIRTLTFALDRTAPGNLDAAGEDFVAGLLAARPHGED